MQQSTKFRETSAKGPLLKSQIVLYALATVYSLILLGLYARAFWLYHHPTTTPGTAATTTATPAPVSAIQPAAVQQVQQPTQATATPYQATDAQMAEWQHIPPGQEQHYAEYQQRLAARATPFPTPYLAPAPDAAPTPDPIVVRLHGQWQTLHDAYVQQVKTRLAVATTNEQKGEIQRDIARWKAANPEPMKPEDSLKPPRLTPGGYEEIPFK